MRPELVERILEFGAVTGSRNEEVDAVVVGSGCGGAVVAKELIGPSNQELYWALP